MEQIAPGITREWKNQQQIVVYRLSSINVTTVVAWSEAVLDTLSQWPKNRPYLALHDISHPGIGLLFLAAVQDDIFNIGILPGARPRVTELLTANPDWKLSLALVVSASLSGRMGKLLFHEEPADPRIGTKAFFNPIAAMNWLLKQTDAEIAQPNP